MGEKRIFAEAAMLGKNVDDSESESISQMINRAAEAASDMPAFAGVIALEAIDTDGLREDTVEIFDGKPIECSAYLDDRYVKLPRVL